MRRFVKASSDAAMSGSTVVPPFGLPPQAANNARMAERVAGRMVCRLTVKLSGRPVQPDQPRGRTLSSRTRGAQPLTHHGPLQRLLEALLVSGLPRPPEQSPKALGAKNEPQRYCHFYHVI